MPNPFTGEKYWYEQDNQSSSLPTKEKSTSSLPITNRELPVNNPVANKNSVPQGSLQGTMTQPKQGSLLDFQKVMRVVSESVYKDRQKKEGKVLKGQFDPSKVSGSIFSQIMGAVESRRGKSASDIYGGAVEAAKFDIEQKEKERQFNVEQENNKFELIKQKTELGIDSVYIPTGTIADRLNNPGNLKFVGQAGATQGEGGFAKFNTPEDGWQALQNQIRLDQSRGLTLAQFVEKYAPSTENDTNLYIQQISQWIGVDPNVSLASLDYELVAEQVAKKESGTQLVKASSVGGGTEAMAKKVKSGEMTISQVPAAKRGDVLAAVETLGQQVSPEQKSVMMNNVSTVNKILENYESISGPIQTGLIPFTEGKKTSKLYDQLKGIVALDKRQMLKGQGQISDFEFKVLGDAASNITRLSSEADFRQALIDIKGAFTTAAGEKAQVMVSKGGQSKSGMLTRDEITDAIAQGFIVKYT
jgi:predicted ATPase